MTLANMPTLKAQYEKDGYIVIPHFFTTDEVKKISQWIDEITQWAPKTGQHLNYYELVNGKKTLSRTENFLPFHESFRNFLMQSEIFPLLNEILGEPAFLFKEKINYKFTGTGQYQAHQDIHAHDTSPLAFQAYHINAAIFVDDATIENGCCEVVPGYKDTVLERNPDGSIVEPIRQQLPWKPVEIAAGGILLFNCWVPHKSERNLSQHARRTIYLTFNGVSHGDLREAHYRDRASKNRKTREINTDLFIEYAND